MVCRYSLKAKEYPTLCKESCDYSRLNRMREALGHYKVVFLTNCFLQNVV